MSRKRHLGPRPTDSAFAREPLTREQRLERKLEATRRDSANWQRRYRVMVSRYQDLERRRAWVEAYFGFRVEYRVRGLIRRLRRYRHLAMARVRARST